MKLFKKILKVLLFFHLFLILAVVSVHCTFQHYASKSYEAAVKKIPFDVVIVPGVPFEDTTMNLIYKARVLWAKYLYDSGYTHNIIFSGTAVYTPYYESRTMKLYAEALGVPPENIFTEERAEHSSENVYFSWKLAKELGFEKIALATDPYQSGMLRGLIKKYTPGVMSLPIQFEKVDARNTSLPLINPSTAKKFPFTPLPERESFWDRWQGTLGRRVKDEARRDQSKN